MALLNIYDLYEVTIGYVASAYNLMETHKYLFFIRYSLLLTVALPFQQFAKINSC